VQRRRGRYGLHGAWSSAWKSTDCRAPWRNWRPGCSRLPRRQVTYAQPLWNSIRLQLGDRMKLGLWIALGVGVGAAIGAALNQMAMGVAFGAAFGVALGSVLSARH